MRYLFVLHKLALTLRNRARVRRVKQHVTTWRFVDGNVSWTIKPC